MSQIPSSYLPLVQTALGGLLAILGALASGLLIESHKRQAERRRTASAFAGEIGAILELASVRKIKASMQDGLNHYEAGGTFEWWDWPLSEDYFRVYKQNIDKIGHFDAPVPQKIAQFYSYCFAIVEDLRSLNSPQKLQSAHYMIKTFREDIEIVTKIEILGGELLSTLTTLSKAEETFKII